MKKFAFPLEQVMKYREYMQNEAALDLGRALVAERKIEGRLEDVAARRAAMTEQIRGSTDFDEIRRANDFYALLAQQKTDLSKRLAEAKLVSEKKRKAMQEAVKKVEPLHRLRERLLDEWKDAENSEAAEIADDITNARTARG